MLLVLTWLYANMGKRSHHRRRSGARNAIQGGNEAQIAVLCLPSDLNHTQG